jgi:hypothetical protein
LSAFESWNDAVARHGIEDPMIEELRTAKVDALDANIARIRAVRLLFLALITC